MREIEPQTENSLAAYSGRHTKVAILASGIDARHPKLARVGGGIEFAVNKAGRVVSGVGTALTDRVGHGTACAGIVHRIAPSAEIISVCVCDEVLAVDGQLLLAALRWALEQRVDIISLSLGCIEAELKGELAAACREAVAQRVIVVAAARCGEFSNYLAQLSDTIGVVGGQVRGYGAYYYRADAEIECIARGDKQRVCWLDRREATLQDSRFAVPHMAGTIALLREKEPQANLAQIRMLLAEYALNPPRVRASLPQVSNAKKASCTAPRLVLYPYNKEMQMLVRFKDLLSCEIVGVAGPMDKAWIGCDAGELVGASAAGLPVVADWSCAGAGGDTLVLGRVANGPGGRDKVRECVERAFARDMHVFSFMSLAHARYADLRASAVRKERRLWYPWIDGRRALAQINARAPLENDVPVLGICSTSSCRESFALQLGLRREFLRRGYALGQLGTEPASRLFGLDFCFPIGAGVDLCLPLQFYPRFIEQFMRQLCAREPDLVLVGSPPGLPFGDLKKAQLRGLSSLAFLLGARPELCILAVDSTDSDEHIEDALAVLRAIGNTRVLALVLCARGKCRRGVLDAEQAGREEVSARLVALQRRFLLPVVPLIGGEERLAELVEDCFFSAQNDHLSKRSDLNAA